jgi:2'-5' RNA ligase
MTKKTNRLFFALWPSEQVRRSIVDASLPLSSQLEGRVIRPQNLHITLHFIGQVTEDIKRCMHISAQTVSVDSFTVKLDRFGYFKRAKILWIGPRQLPDELVRLHQDLGKALSPCGYKSETRQYNPHVSLMRKCARPKAVQNELTIPWSANEFVLVESIQTESGVDYQVIEHYPLLQLG